MQDAGKGSTQSSHGRYYTAAAAAPDYQVFIFIDALVASASSVFFSRVAPSCCLARILAPNAGPRPALPFLFLPSPPPLSSPPCAIVLLPRLFRSPRPRSPARTTHGACGTNALAEGSLPPSLPPPKWVMASVFGRVGGGAGGDGVEATIFGHVSKFF